MLSIAFGQSKYYVDNLSENVKRGLRTKLRRGEWPGGAPLGYTTDYRTHTVVPHPEKALLVRKLFELYATGDYSLTEVYREAVRWGLTGTTGKPVYKSGVAFTLRNPFYYGLMRCGECGCMITAETQKGHVYYRCTKKKRGASCTQKFLREEALLAQICQALARVSLDQETAGKIVQRWEAEGQAASNASSAYSRQIAGQLQEL